MNWRVMILSGALLAGSSLTAAPDVHAKHHYDYYYDDDGDDCDQRAGHVFGGSGRRYGGECGQVYDRIHFDRSKIDEIRPTGRHRKALQWYVDDLRNAQRDLERCRYGNYTAAGYDPYYQQGGYDDFDRPFDWKRDWPELLGAVLSPSR